ncbi:hypothetical protein C8R46DRAFT_1348815, partial [Mycena filopes]
MPNCLVCHEDYANDRDNYLLTCDQCDKSWHHRCHEPPIPRATLVRMWTEYLASPQQRLKPQWMCPKCSRRKAAAAVNAHPHPAPSTEVSATPSTRRIGESRSTAEIIDLTESPAVSTNRVQPAQPRVVEVLDISPPATPTPAVSSGSIIDLSLDDSPQFAPQPLPDLAPAPLPVAVSSLNLPAAVVVIDASVAISPLNFPATVAVIGAPSSQADLETLRERPVSRSPSFRTPAIPDPPSRVSTPSVTRLQFMDVDEVEQKPIIAPTLLLEKLTLSERVLGGTLGPSWMRERLEMNGQMALWKQIVAKQEMPKQLSRRKPAKTRFVGKVEPFFVL